MKIVAALVIVVTAAVLVATSAAAPATGSCLFAYESEGGLYENTLYLFGIRQKAVRIDIVDTTTETVTDQVFGYGSYLAIEPSYVDSTTEFRVYASNVKPSDGGSGKLLAECYA